MAARRYLLPELGDTEIARWSDLAAGAVEPNPFFEPEYVLPAAKGLAEPDVSLLVVEADGEWRACLPVQRTRLGRVLGALRTWRHRYCFLGTPLLHPANPADAAHELLALGADEAPGSRLALEQFADDGPAGAAIWRAAQALSLATLVETRHERALLERSEDGQAAAWLSRNRRRSLERRRRQMEEELGAALEVRDEAGDPSAVERFLAMELAGWKGRNGTALACETGHAEFFRRMCRAFAAAGRLELLSLSAGGRTAAMLCVLTSGEGAFGIKTAHDEALGRFGPGVQLEYQVIRHFHERRAERWQDSCADPGNELMNQLWPGRRGIASAVFAPSGPYSSVLSMAAKRSRRAADPAAPTDGGAAPA